MSQDALAKVAPQPLQWYDEISTIRGCSLSLPHIKAAYRELVRATHREGEQVVSQLYKPDHMSEEDFSSAKIRVLDEAFRVTVSIIGYGGETSYGESEDIFDSDKLPSQIKSIFFTNITAFKRNNNGILPDNRFEILINFDKPPLLDPNPLVSEPTSNDSNVTIYSKDIVYYRAIQNIVSTKIKQNKIWYAPIHNKLVYDLGLWILWIPMALYFITIYCDYFIPQNGKHASFRVAFYIYGFGLSIMMYRILFSYTKWVFPVNTLSENRDKATNQRWILGTILIGIVTSLIWSVLSTGF